MVKSYKDKYLKYKMKYNKLKGGWNTPIGRSIKIIATNEIYTITGQNEDEYFTNGPLIDKDQENIEWCFLHAEINTLVDLYDSNNVIIYSDIIIDEDFIDNVPVWILDHGEKIYKHDENTDRNWRITPPQE